MTNLSNAKKYNIFDTKYKFFILFYNIMSYWKRLSILYAAYSLLSKARNLLIRPILTQQRYAMVTPVLCWCVAKPSVMQLPRLGIKSVQGIFLEFVNEIAYL